MPLEEKDMEKLLPNQTIDRKYTDFLAQMKKGQYYSQAEITAMILGKPLAINEALSDIKSANFKTKLQNFGDVVADISFVNCALEVNIALGKLKVAEKKNDLYYALV